MYSGSYDQKIRVWSLDRLMCLQTLSKFVLLFIFCYFIMFFNPFKQNRHEGSIDALLGVDDMPEYDNFIVRFKKKKKKKKKKNTLTSLFSPTVPQPTTAFIVGLLLQKE